MSDGSAGLIGLERLQRQADDLAGRIIGIISRNADADKVHFESPNLNENEPLVQDENPAGTLPENYDLGPIWHR